MTVFYDNSDRERVETINKFRSNMRNIATGIAPDYYMFANERFPYYEVYRRPKNWWYALGNLLFHGLAMYQAVAFVRLFDNASVKISVYGDMEVSNRIADFLDRGNFRVTVVDYTAKEITP